MTWKEWLTALANAAVSGAASGFVTNGLGVSAKKSLIVAGVSATVSAAKWIVQNQNRFPGLPAETAKVPDVTKP